MKGPISKKAPIDSSVKLRQELGFVGTLSFVIGNVIGSGIFVSPKGVLQFAGSTGLSIIIWATCGLFSLVGSFAYAELGTAIPKSGGGFIFLLDAFAPERSHTKPSWWRPLMAFLYNWEGTFITRPGVMAILSLTFGEYLVRLGSFQCPDLMNFHSPQTAVKLLAICMIFILWFVNVMSVKSAARMQILFTGAKVLALAMLILGGIMSYFYGETKLHLGFEGSNYEFHNIVSAFYSGMWAFSGWTNICMITDEIRNPKKNIPSSLFVSLIVITIIYLGVNISYWSVLSVEEVLESNAVAVSFTGRLLGPIGMVVVVAVVAISSFGSGNSSLFTNSRTGHVAAVEGHMLEVVSYIHIKYLTPATSITLIAITSIFYVCITEMLTIIRLTGFTEGFFLTLWMIALLKMRRRKDADPKAFKAPFICIILFLLFGIFLCVTPLVSSPKIEYMYVVLFFFVGALVYVIFVHYKLCTVNLNSLNRSAQVLFEVAPPEIKDK